MKLSRLLVIPGFIGLIFILKNVVPSEEEIHQRKLKFLDERNFLEKQFVGKWNHSDFPAGLENNRNYYLLSADGSCFYRGSDKSKVHGGSWLVQVADSVLYLNLKPTSNSAQYKIIDIQANHISLQKIENDSLTTKIKWFRHP